MQAMDLSLARDVLRRVHCNLGPPGGCLTFIDQPLTRFC